MMEKPSPRLIPAATTTTGTILIPRPKSVYSKRDPARQDDSYQSWMQEYHRQHQHQRNQQFYKASTLQHSGISPNAIIKAPGSPSNSLSRKSKGTNLFLNFNSLKIHADDTNNNALKENGLIAPCIEGKGEQTETFEGYKIYKGHGNVTLGVSKQNTPSVANSVDNFYNVHKVPDTTNETVLTPYAPLILPDKFILAPSKTHVHDNKSVLKITPQTPRHITTPFHIQLHPQRRPRPHSASIDFSPSTKDKNGNKTKDISKNVKNAKTSYKAPTVTTIQLHSSEAIALTPRSIPTQLPAKARTTTDDNNNNIDKKSDQQNGLPKSILKNHKDSTTPPPYTIQLGIANYGKTPPSSNQKAKNEFAYHELIVSPGKTQNNTSPTGTLYRHGSLSHQKAPAFHRVPSSGADTKRPKSASATSKYELIDRSPSPRRKSVTFNSYVSFSSDSRVSTIRAMPVDA